MRAETVAGEWTEIVITLPRRSVPEPRAAKTPGPRTVAEGGPGSRPPGGSGRG
jgi:hypothetical protein